MRSSAAVIAGLLALSVATSAWSQSNSGAKIQPHLLPAGGSNPCNKAGSRPACAGIVSAGDLNPSLYYAYLLVTDGSIDEGVAGLQFGIDYGGALGSGVDVFSWTRCGDLDFSGPGWPAAGTGNLITWSPSLNCQTIQPGGNGSGVVAVAGFLYLGAYSSDALVITPHPATGQAKVADCSAAESVIPIPSLGTAQFSAGATVPGHNPCVGAPPPPATCQISGLSSVTPGSTNNYSVSVSGQNPVITWSITGNGMIPGPTNGSQVSVDAGLPGSFTLNVQFTSSAGPGTCSKSVSVQTPSGTCTVTGPTAVATGSTSTFGIGAGSPTGTRQWTISGNGSIVGSTSGQSVQVQAGPPGSFNIALSINSSTQCSKNVTVTSSTPEGPNQQNAKILVHLRTPATKNVCVTRPPCNQIVSSGGLYPPNLYFAYVLVANGYTTGAFRSGVAGVQFGIQYNSAPVSGVDVFNWSLCGDIEFASSGWPDAGTGNLITWDSVNNCQQFEPGGGGTGVVATAGYFYVGAYTSDILRMTPRPIDGAAKVANCFGAESLIAQTGFPTFALGYAGFGANPGYNPCGLIIPVENTTWSRIKTMTH